MNLGNRRWKPVHTSEQLQGHFRRYADFASRHLRYSRDILVYLPPSYDQEPFRHYPVLYLHDGNNLFDPKTSFLGVEWQLDEHLEALIQTDAIEEVIAVGIYNTPDRNSEYTWLPRQDETGAVEGGDGPRYARFLVEELKPAVDRAFRTRPEREATAVAGSSLGGLMSFYLGLYYPDVFSGIGMLSPSLWWQYELLLPAATHLSQALKLWIDMGTREGGVDQAQAFVAQLGERGYLQGDQLFFSLACCAEHNEAAWSKRVGEMLRFFYGPPGTAQAFGPECEPCLR